ncbi:MAG: hypothetical protein ACI8SE_001521 [Bacteroidia bacterium]|jgi:hypothetical protein
MHGYFLITPQMLTDLDNVAELLNESLAYVMGLDAK